MKKLLVYSRDTLTENEVAIVEAKKQYIGYLTDDRQTLTIQGNGHDVVIEGGKDGTDKSRPYYTSPDAKRFYIVRQLEPMERIEIEIYLPDPEDLRYVKLERKRTVGEVFQDIKQALNEQEVMELLDYFNISSNDESKGDEVFPDYRWISVFLVKGDSEGYYFHIEVIDGNRQLLYLGKTLSENIEEALKINNILVRLFQG